MGGPSDEIGELTRQAGAIVRRLKAVSDDPAGSRAAGGEELTKLKSFCLILSKRSAAAKKATGESKHPHPYRREG